MNPKAGTVALIGRPNAGKSTLLNRFLTEKLAIVSDKPQTTRHRLVGIHSNDRGQMVFYDTPGVHRPLHHLNRQMVRYAVDALESADVICLIADASVSFGSGDRYLLDLVSNAKGLRVAVLNKVDRIRKTSLLPLIRLYDEPKMFEEIVPISAITGDGTDELMEVLWGLLPQGEQLYDPDLQTVHSERFLVAERIREKVLHLTRAELPFTTAVVLDSWDDLSGGERDGGGLLEISASILVERSSQKKILVGKRGAMIKQIGIDARQDLERFLGRRIHLDLFVRHEPRWRENRQLLAHMERDLIGIFDGGSGSHSSS
jgi:GTP-binding protein Era